MYENALKANDKITGISYDLLESQIWSLLASFCSNPSDISMSFRVRLNINNIKLYAYIIFKFYYIIKKKPGILLYSESF